MRFPMKGVCAKWVELEITDGKISKLEVVGGCDGNRQGVAKLALGQEAMTVAHTLEGIHCGFKNTSCPDQIAHAIYQYLQQG